MPISFLKNKLKNRKHSTRTLGIKLLHSFQPHSCCCLFSAIRIDSTDL